MSIKGFEVGGVQERYDYTALDNTPANLVQDANYVHTDNNFTNADKTKLDGIATGANKTIIDATLTQSGQAADAKAAGDEINDLKSAFTANLIHDTATGAIANFPDGAAMPVRDLSVDIEPVQDLNGYDNPWPAVGGENKLAPLASETINTGKGITITSDGNGTYTIKGTATAEVIVDRQLPASYTIASGDYLHLCNNSALGGVALGIRDATDTGIASAGTSSINRVLTLSDYASREVGYLRFYIESGVTIDMTIKPMICKSSTAISFSPYSNICPISGWTGAKVTRTGKNLFSYNNITRKQIYRSTLRPMGDDLNSFYLCGASGSTDEAMLDVASWAYVTAFIGFRVKEDTPITVSCKVKNYTADCNGFVRVRYNTTENRDGSTVVNTVFFNTVGTSNISISGTIPSGNYVFFEFSPAAKGESVTLTQYAEVTDFQFEVGSTASPYESYQSTTYTIDLNGTRYGGTLDVTSGKLAVTHGFKSFDGTEAWVTEQADNFFTDVIADSKRTSLVQSSLLPSINVSYVSGTNNVWISGSGRVNATIPSITHTVEAFKALLAELAANGTPFQVCYELATPIEVDLTPAEITTLLGTNNIFADCGDTTVDYYADPTLYINRKIAAAVAAMS